VDDEESEEYDPDADDEDPNRDSFYVGDDYRDPNAWKEPLPRLGPEDLNELDEAVRRMNPKYRKAEEMILEEKLETAVNDRLARLRKANHLNAILSFGRVEQIPPVGTQKIPSLICVHGHSGAGGNIGVNGIYERYPDNYCKRPVWQKYMERDNWVSEPQEIEFLCGTRAPALGDLDDVEGDRRFPDVFDSPRTKEGLRRMMLSSKVLPARKQPGAVGNFRRVAKAESWFIFFDDCTGAWCIGPKPGLGAVFARCFGVDVAVPDNLGPDAWQVFDVGHRSWYTHRNLHTMKGGTFFAD
jgi:hypothetical protein